jgi:hypothetical protein
MKISGTASLTGTIACLVTASVMLVKAPPLWNSGNGLEAAFYALVAAAWAYWAFRFARGKDL